MAPCLLFCPCLEELHRGKRVVFNLKGWQVAVDAQVADELLLLRKLLADFISHSVGHTPTEVHTAATDALSQLFSEKAPTTGGVEEDDEGEVDGEVEMAGS